MGLLARVIQIENGDDNEVIQTVEAHYGENKYCDQFSSSGDDAPPLPEDRVVLVDIEGTGNACVVGTLVYSQGAEPGEKLIYSRNSDGDLVAKIHLKKDGKIEVEADDDISIKTNGKLIIEAAKDVEVKINANVKIDAGNNTVEVKAKSINFNNGNLEVS